MGLDQDFPVPERSVPRVRAPAARLEEWKEVAQDEIMRALSSRHSWYNAFKDKLREGFDLVADKPNLKAFVRPVPGTNDKDILIRSTLEGVHLDELVAGMYCDTTYDARCTFAHLYEGNFLDAAVLQAHETRTDEDPLHFVGVRWIAFRSPAPALVTSRDFLYFSYEGTAYDVDGSRVLFRFLRSMPMDGIDVDKTGIPPLVTGKISNLHFYRQNGSRVDAFSKAMHSNAGNMPAWVVTKTISFMFPGIANVETICDARALLQNGTAKLNPGRQRPLAARASTASASVTGSSLSRHQLAVLASASACGVCFHKFKLTRPKRRCQGCVREVCKRCTKRMFFFDEQKQISDTGVVALRFCLNCTRQARADIREAAAATSHRASLSTRRSSLGSAGSGSAGSGGRLGPHHQQQQLARRVPSAGSNNSGGGGHRAYYQPEMEPPYAHSSTTSHDQDDSDDESVSFDTDAPHSLTTTTSQHRHAAAGGSAPTSAPLPLLPQQLEQLQLLQQQHQYDPKDHAEFLRLYNEYAARHQQQQQQGKLISIQQLARNQHGVPPPAAAPPQHAVPSHPSKHFRRQNSGGFGWSHSGVEEASAAGGGHRMHTMPDVVPRHMIPPMPQPDRPAARGDHHHHHLIPLHAAGRTNSAPNLHAIDAKSMGSMHAPAAPRGRESMTAAPSAAGGAGSASEDLETIFRLRMMLFNGTGDAETETMSTTSSSTSSYHTAAAQRKALTAAGEPLAPRY